MPIPSPDSTSGHVTRFVAWVKRAGRLEIAVLSACLLAAAGLWAFGTLAAKVVEGDTHRFDDRILLALRQPGNLALPIGPHWTLQVARDLTAFGSAVGIGLIAASVVGYLALQRRYGLAGFVLFSLLTGTILSVILKDLFHRPRPQVVPHLTDISSASFPSGHSMMSSIAYLTMAALLARSVKDVKTKLYCFVLAILLVWLIGMSRLYLGVHFPTDVLAGWCIGSTWAVLCSLTAHFISSRRDVPRAKEFSDESL